MTSPKPLVLTRQYEEESLKWLEALKRGENLMVLYFPKTDRQRRMYQLLSDNDRFARLLGTGTKYVFLISSVENQIIEDMRDVRDQMETQLRFSGLIGKQETLDKLMVRCSREHMRIVFINAHADALVHPDSGKTFELFSVFARQYSPHIKFLHMFETDILHPGLISQLPTDTSLLQNVFYYPLYSFEDTTRFVKYLADKWDYKYTAKLAETIYRNCGGHFWFVKESFRHLVATKRLDFGEENLNFRLRTVYNSMRGSERDAIRKCITGTGTLTEDEKSSLKYLEKMRILRDRKCQVQLLCKYIRNQQTATASFTNKNDVLVLNDVPLAQIFSRKEYRVLRHMIEHQGELISRDSIAKCLWPQGKPEDYSDWAIDRIVARIRKRLGTLSLPEEILVTRRGKGYVFSPNYES